ncbi:GGDEF domain-containing protein [Microbulbifer sp. 2201CG32-9]|uniref:GGDEF domain-containing protein n=1 Tax=Microbulbifer sp. 2201CG32-9 TaxID=3232309 RepID=UPI00345BDE53
MSVSGPFSSGAENPIEEARQLELRRRIQASGYMLIFSFAITGAMGVIALTRGEIVVAGALFAVTTVILSAYFTIHLAGSSPKTPTLVGVLLLVLYFYLLLSGGVNNSGLMWAVMLVPGFINLYGYKLGTSTLVAVGAVTVAVLFTPEFPLLAADYDTAYRVRFIAVFGALTALTALLDSSRHQTQQLLHRLTQQLERNANTDALTGLPNRRQAYKSLSNMERRNRELSGRYTVLIGDLDNFKTINDRFGHPFGDRVLRDVAEILRRNTRKGDVVARWGGEEFLVLLPNTNLGGGRILAEKLRARVEALSSRYPQPVCVSISFGVAEGHCSHSTHGKLLAAADARMYRAKKSGRNRVMAT